MHDRVSYRDDCLGSRRLISFNADVLGECIPADDFALRSLFDLGDGFFSPKKYQTKEAKISLEGCIY